MPGYILAAGVTPDNTPHGYNLTFGFPMLLFIAIGAILYLLLFALPHQRVPARRITAPVGSSAGGASAGAAVAGGYSASATGSTTESADHGYSATTDPVGEAGGDSGEAAEDTATKDDPEAGG